MITVRKSLAALAAAFLVLTLQACGVLSMNEDIATQAAHDSEGG